MKEAFSVAYHEGKVVIHGVTSIVPNLNGILLQTQAQKNYQIASYQMDQVTLNLAYYDPVFDEVPDDYEILDGRE